MSGEDEAGCSEGLGWEAEGVEPSMVTGEMRRLYRFFRYDSNSP